MTGAVEKARGNGGYFLTLRALSDPAELTAFLRTWNVEGLLIAAGAAMTDDGIQCAPAAQMVRQGL